MSTHLPPSLLLALAVTAGGALPAQDHRPVAFTNAQIVPISGAPIERGTLVIKNGKIEAVGRDVVPPAGARVIDASGRTIMPGLVSAYSSAGLASNQPRPEPRGERGGRRGPPLPMPGGSGGGTQNRAATKVIDGLYAHQPVFGDLLRAGITSLALTPPGNAFAGLGAILAPDGKTLAELSANDAAFVQITMARENATKKLLTESLDKAQKIVEERRKPKAEPQPAAAETKTAEPKAGAEKKPEGEPGKEPPKPEQPQPDQPKPAPQQQPQQPPEQPKPEQPQPDQPKPAPQQQPPEQPKPEAKKDPNLELLADLLEGKQRAMVTIPSATDLLHWNVAVAAKVAFPRTVVIPRHDPYSGTVDLVVDELKQLGCSVLLPPDLTTKPRTRHVIHPAKLLHDAGIEVGFLPGDSPATVRLLFFRLMELVRCGLPADVALKGVTLVPAKALGIADQVGSLEPGKDANLLVFAGDPLSPTGTLEAVWFRGRLVEPKP